MSKRKKLLINRPFQMVFLGYHLAVGLIVAAIFLIADNYFYMRLLSNGEKIGLPPTHYFYRFLEQEHRAMNLFFWIVAIVCTILIIINGLYLSNRVAGPLNRIRHFLEESMNEKGATPIQVRKNDFFPDLAEAVSKYVDKFSQGK